MNKLLKKYRKKSTPLFFAVRYTGTLEQAAQIVKMDTCFVRKYHERDLVIEIYYKDREPVLLKPGYWLVQNRFGRWYALDDMIFFELFEELA